MAILMLKTGRRAKATAHRAVTVLPGVSAASDLSAQRATSARMTALKRLQKAAIHATNAGMTVAHAVTTLAKPR